MRVHVGALTVAESAYTQLGAVSPDSHAEAVARLEQAMILGERHGGS